MNFEFATATRIIFGPGTVKEVGPLAATMGSNASVITGRTGERAQPVLAQLKSLHVNHTVFNVPHEPTTTLLEAAIYKARQAGADMVISIGGGSVLDTGKAIAAMITNKGRLQDYLEVVGASKPLSTKASPHIAIPTTAGTGAEVTRNAVLGVPEHKVKVSMRSSLMLPTVAIVDPELTYSLPPTITASTGLDTLTQLLEAFVSSKANPLTDGICREGIRRAAISLQKAYEDGSNQTAREDMTIASLFSGLALANAKLGAVHGFAGPLGGMISAPHGVICARLLPHVMEANVLALQSRAADSPALTRYDQVAQLLTDQATAKASDGVKWVQCLCQILNVPPLTEFQLKEDDFPALVSNARNSSSMKGNPITLTDEELMEILKKA